MEEEEEEEEGGGADEGLSTRRSAVHTRSFETNVDSRFVPQGAPRFHKP